MKYSTCRCVFTWLAIAIGAVILLAAGSAAAYIPKPMRVSEIFERGVSALTCGVEMNWAACWCCSTFGV